MSASIRLPFHVTPDEVEAPVGWSVTRIADAYEQLPVGRRYDSKTVAENGSVPVIDQSPRGVLGYHNADPGIAASAERPVVTFANHTCAMRVMTEPFSVIQNVFPMVGRESICDTRYLYYATNGRQSTEDYKGHHPAWRNSFIELPDIHMQHKIIEFVALLTDVWVSFVRVVRDGGLRG